MDEHELRRRVASSPVARLATLRADGTPHIVPVCFALEGDRIVSVVDHKPKSTTSLRRLDNVRAHPAVSLLVDHYDDDWTRLWWVRVDGTAIVRDVGTEHESAIESAGGEVPPVPRPAPGGFGARDHRVALAGMVGRVSALRYRSGGLTAAAGSVGPRAAVDRGSPAHQALRRLRRSRRHRLLRRGGRVLRVPRAERRREDVDDAHDRVRVAGHRWRAARVRPRSSCRRAQDPFARSASCRKRTASTPS